jgi:hypothetical protein
MAISNCHPSTRFGSSHNRWQLTARFLRIERVQNFNAPRLSLSQILFGQLVVEPESRNSSLKLTCSYRKSFSFNPAFSVVRRKASPAADIAQAMMISGEAKFDLAFAAIKALNNTAAIPIVV